MGSELTGTLRGPAGQRAGGQVQGAAKITSAEATIFNFEAVSSGTYLYISGIISLLDEEDPQLKGFALHKLNAVVNDFWAGISESVDKIEVLYEDEDFWSWQFAALVAFKVFYHLGAFEESLNYALGAGDLFNVNNNSEYVETIIGTVEPYSSLKCEVVWEPGFSSPERGEFVFCIDEGNSLPLKCVTQDSYGREWDLDLDLDHSKDIVFTVPPDLNSEPIQFIKHIQNIVVSEPQSATFEYEVPFDDAIVTWYQGPTELIESQKYSFRNDGRCHYMTIHKVTPDDEGIYSVIAQLEPRGEARSTAELHLTTKEIKFEMKPPDIPDSRVPTPTMPIRVVPPEEIKTFSSCPIRNSAMLQFGCQFICSTHTKFCSLVNNSISKGTLQDGNQNVQLLFYQKECHVAIWMPIYTFNPYQILLLTK